jgi:hypothetical protein
VPVTSQYNVLHEDMDSNCAKNRWYSPLSPLAVEILFDGSNRYPNWIRTHFFQSERSSERTV